ncbi:MAG: hypothetical protein Q7T53_09685 [Deltaproteobacteria bacterium]|nr:hypothetical protein [Deltaproteobacteria bacterium]
MIRINKIKKLLDAAVKVFSVVQKKEKGAKAHKQKEPLKSKGDKND